MPAENIRKLSVIVPCFNEDLNAHRFQKELIECLNVFSFETEYIFIDDGSTDKTAEIINELTKRNSTVKLYSHERNEGLGAAIKTGLTYATGDAILVVDADLTFHPSQFPLLLEKWEEGVDCVSGSSVKGGFRGVPFIRRLLSVLVNRVYELTLGVPVTSASSIFRLYRKSALDLFTFERNSFDINAEILSQFLLTGHRVVEVPAVLTDRFMGQSKIKIGREIKNHLLMFGKIIYWKITLRHGKK